MMRVSSSRVRQRRGVDLEREANAMMRVLVCFSLLMGSASASISGAMKDMMCSVAKVPIVCSHSSHGSSSKSCSGPACCKPSSCYSIPGSVFACKKSRGPTKCTGAQTFPYPKAGVCQCTAGACSVSGTCPNAGGTSRLYEVDGAEEVTPEDFTLAFAGLGLFCCCVFLATATLAIRLRRRWRPAPPAGAEALVSSDSEAVAPSAVE
mmetsp:Transcript_13505/g.43106  ORF Transcript_13505/g.43106 Transcript_13505/m.43106 type:complete len:207 (-) Transcript_13505:284-904(-)